MDTVQISNTIDSILSSDPSIPQDLTDAQLQARKHLLSLSENVIALVWCLAETSHKTLAAVNTAGVEGLLIKVLQGREVCGLGVALAAGESSRARGSHSVFPHPHFPGGLYLSTLLRVPSSKFRVPSSKFRAPSSEQQ
jgi:hypothetical protein